VRRPRSRQGGSEPRGEVGPAARPGRTDQLLASRVIFISAIGEEGMEGSTSDGACIGPRGFALLNVIRWNGTLVTKGSKGNQTCLCRSRPDTSPPGSLQPSDAMGARQTRNRRRRGSGSGGFRFSPSCARVEINRGLPCPSPGNVQRSVFAGQ
jgi:hypothetical protein